MTSWLGQYCINVTDLDASVGFYSALGLDNTSRTEIPQAFEAIVEHPGRRVEAATGPAEGAGRPVRPRHRPLEALREHPRRRGHLRRRPRRRRLGGGGARADGPLAGHRGLRPGPDGYLVELVERHPWPDDAPAGAPWLGQYCLNVTDIEATIGFYELLGLTCTSRTEIPHAHEAIVEQPGRGGKLQLAQQVDQDGPIRMGSMWKLYVNTDDCAGLHGAPSTPGTRRSWPRCGSTGGR